MEVKLLAITKALEGDGSPDHVIEVAGRTCWRTELNEEKRDPFITRLISLGHESVIEHASATFQISGISRACSHQIVRHRLASYSQESLRYVEFDAQFVVPPSIIDESYETMKITGNDKRTPLEIVREFYNEAQAAYARLRALGIRKEDARFVLPIGVQTKLVMTANFREWRHFIKVRATKHAQWEIRRVAKEVLRQLYHQCSPVFRDLYEEFIV